MDTDIKPGWTTSEFWVTVITNIVAVINMFWNVGIQNETINTIASLVAMVGMVGFYIWTRMKLKQAAIANGSIVE